MDAIDLYATTRDSLVACGSLKRGWHRFIFIGDVHDLGSLFNNNNNNNNCPPGHNEMNARNISLHLSVILLVTFAITC
jgi:hypothetical protein